MFDGARQLTLGVALREGQAFDNFVAGGNGPALAAMRALAQGGGAPVCLWGGAGTGKTHLLQAACANAAAGGRPTAYVPLSTHAELDPAMLAGLDSAGLVCLDDIAAIAGLRPWEEAIFHLYNQAESAGVPLAVAAERPPPRLPVGLPDLKSRLAAATVFKLVALDDAARGEVLTRRAQARGFAIPDEAVAYLLTRGPRDMHSLMALLERLDALSLSQQRKITVPLVREALSSAGLSLPRHGSSD